MTTPVRTWIVLLALVGLLAAAVSSFVHLELLRDPGYTSFCDLNANVSCTQGLPESLRERLGRASGRRRGVLVRRGSPARVG